MSLIRVFRGPIFLLIELIEMAILLIDFIHNSGLLTTVMANVVGRAEWSFFS